MPPILDFHFLLVAVTLVYCLLVLLVWQRSRNPGFPMGFFFLYYWTLSGAWDLVTDLSGGHSGKRYSYLLDKLFPVELNGDYFLALIYYSLFLLLVALTVYLVLPGAEGDGKGDLRPEGDKIRISHLRLILGSLICLAVAIFLVRDQLLQAMVLNKSGYQITATGDQAQGLFRLHQSFNNLMVIPPALGIPILAAGKSGRFFTGSSSRFIVLGYLFLGAVLLAYAMVMGNKHELFTGLVTGTILYFVIAPKPRFIRLGAGFVVIFLGIIAIDYTRSLSLTELAQGVNLAEAGDSFGSILSSNESFSAHFSLYGVLHYSVPLTWGTSLVSLLASGVPRLFWATRPESVYHHYVTSVGAAGDQGYTIHHATGWYLNFGVVGIVFGAVFLGGLWAGLYRRTRRNLTANSLLWAAFPAVGFAFFTGGIPGLVRGGIEAYKAVILYSFLAPMLVLWLAKIRLRA